MSADRQRGACGLRNQLVSLLLRNLEQYDFRAFLSTEGPKSDLALPLLVTRTVRIILAAIFVARRDWYSEMYLQTLTRVYRSQKYLFECVPLPLTEVLDTISLKGNRYNDWTIPRHKYAEMCVDMRDPLLYVLPEGVMAHKKNKDMKRLFLYVNVTRSTVNGVIELTPLDAETINKVQSKIDAEGFQMIGKARGGTFIHFTHPNFHKIA